MNAGERMGEEEEEDGEVICCCDVRALTADDGDDDDEEDEDADNALADDAAHPICPLLPLRLRLGLRTGIPSSSTSIPGTDVLM